MKKKKKLAKARQNVDSTTCVRTSPAPDFGVDELEVMACDLFWHSIATFCASIFPCCEFFFFFFFHVTMQIGQLRAVFSVKRVPSSWLCSFAPSAIDCL